MPLWVKVAIGIAIVVALGLIVVALLGGGQHGPGQHGGRAFDVGSGADDPHAALSQVGTRASPPALWALSAAAPGHPW